MTHFRTETFKNYLPGVVEFTGSAVEEILAQVEAPAVTLALFGPAQPQRCPGHHLRPPKRTATRKFIFIFNYLRHNSGVAEITQQVLSVERSLVRADELEYFGLRHRSHLVFFHHRGSCSHRLSVSQKRDGPVSFLRFGNRKLTLLWGHGRSADVPPRGGALELQAPRLTLCGDRAGKRVTRFPAIIDTSNYGASNMEMTGRENKQQKVE